MRINKTLSAQKKQTLVGAVGLLMLLSFTTSCAGTSRAAQERKTWSPKSNPPADVIDVVSLGALNNWEKLAVISLQGLTSRKEPSIWLLVREELDAKWLKVHEEKGYIKASRPVEDWKELFEKHRGAYKGAVVPDENLYHGVLHAINVAACEDLIVAPEALAKELDIPIKIDLRDRFETNAAGYEWIWRTYRDRLSKQIASIIYPEWAFNGSLAYDIQWRGLMFWVSGDNQTEQSRKGTDHHKELATMTSIMEQLPPNMSVRGFPYAPGHLGLTENHGIAWLSRLGKAHNCSDHLPNLSVMSGIQIDALSPPRTDDRLLLEDDKIYIALTITDGDNLNTWTDWFHEDFEHPDHGKVPVGWGIGPAILDLMPAVAQWYYEKAVPGKDEFIADVTGIGYIYPEMYATQYPGDRQRILDEYIDWTRMYMDRLGLRHLRTYFDTPNVDTDGYIERFFKGIPSLDAVWDGYCRRLSKYDAPYEKQTYLVGQKPVFSAVMKAGWIYGTSVEDFYRDVHEVVGDQRPAFVNGALINWSFRVDDINEIYNNRREDMVFVTPSQLTDLYLKHIASE